MFAIVTRRSALSDYQPLSVVEAGSTGQRGWWLLLVAIAGIALWLLALKSIADGAVGSIEAWPWLIALIVIGACWWQIDRMRGVPLALHIERREAVLLIVALIVVFGVLAFQIGQIPNSMWGDEGAFFVNARDAARGAAAPDLFGLGTYAEPAFTTIFQSWFVSLLGANVTAWRLSSVIAAWLAAVPLYFLVRDTLGKRTAWIALAFYAISPWVLTYARMGYNASQGILPVVLSLALTWLAVRRDSRFYAFLAGGAAGSEFICARDGAHRHRAGAAVAGVDVDHAPGQRQNDRAAAGRSRVGNCRSRRTADRVWHGARAGCLPWQAIRIVL